LPGSQFSTSTRLKNSSADVEVNLGAGTISVAISLMEGVKAGLRSFQKKVYTGSGPLPRVHACAGRSSTQGPVSECRQRTDKNGELFSNHCGARTIHPDRDRLKDDTHLRSQNESVGNAIGSPWVDDPLNVGLNEGKLRQLNLIVPFEDQFVLGIPLPGIRHRAGEVAADLP
jgi:hypothetical protein